MLKVAEAVITNGQIEKGLYPFYTIEIGMPVPQEKKSFGYSLFRGLDILQQHIGKRKEFRVITDIKDFKRLRRPLPELEDADILFGSF